jgi:predicted ATPase/DNA-binding SARP family transcriptional activator
VAPLGTERLPVRLTPLVGRRDELSAVVRMLTESRLVTLTGPGGTGKTRLALAAAAVAGPSFPVGTCWVELAAVEDPGVIGHEVAGRLGVPGGPGRDAVSAITEHVGDAAVLLVLDNCEHVTAAAARLAHDLLTSCASLSILATSREVLGVEGERSWRVPPLSLPEPDQVPAAESLTEFDAIKLFEQRAQLIAPSFRLTAGNAAAVVQVCSRLDGLPLAIELAAARMRILSVGQLAERLDDVFGLLVGGARLAPARHQALRATLDWSYDLLDDDERAVFRRLAVFPGGFTLAAAEQVAGGDIPAGRTLELLARLADKSLLQVDHADAGARYQLLGTVREYARERLAQTPDDDQARSAQLRYYVLLVEQITARIEGGASAEPDALERELNLLDAERPNLRAALDYARERNDANSALRIASPLGHYAHVRGHYHEVRQWMDDAVTASEETPTSLRAAALLGSGRLALLECDYVPAVRRLEAALRLFRELGDQHGVAAALQVLGSVAREQGRYARSAELHQESLATARAAGDQRRVASVSSLLGFTLWLQCEWDRADEQCSAALRMFRDLGDADGIASSLINLGTIARYRGDRDTAAELLADSRARSQRISFREGMAWSLEQLGLLALEAGDAAAAALLYESLAIHHEVSDRWRTCSVLDDLAALALAAADPAGATELLAMAAALRETIGTIVAPCERSLHEQTSTGAEQALGARAFAAAWRRGQARSVDELLAVRAAGAAAAAAADDVAAAGDSAEAPADGHARGSAELLAPASVVPAPREPPDAENGPRAAGARGGLSRRSHASGSGGASGPETDGTLRIRALGAATVHRGDTAVTAADWGYAKPRELLFLLVASPPLARDQIGAALWPELPTDRLANALHSALRGVRRALGDADWVSYADGRYSFNSARENDCDLDTFEQSLAAARRARPTAAALPDLQQATAAYGGAFLAGMTCGDWAEARRDELARSFESALLALGRLHAAAGRFQPAAAAFRRAVAHEPLNETAHRELMASWARLGEPARAVRHYEQLVELLRDQVGVPPAAETTALYRQLLPSP